MDEGTIIGIDLAKGVFQLHGASADGRVMFRKKLSRAQMLAFFTDHSRCLVAMEACATAHYWGRVIADLGYSVRLIAPAYVKPFVKRQKNDVADAEAIVEAASRQSMRFVAIKSTRQQAGAIMFRTRDLFVRQRTQLVNALRGHLAEHGLVAPVGVWNLEKLEQVIEEADSKIDLLVLETARLYLEQIEALSKRICGLEKVLKAEASRENACARLMTMPGIGPITAMAIATFAPSMETFQHGRDFAAWLGLVPRQHSSGGKSILGRTSKMGQRDIRRLLIMEAMTGVQWAGRKGPSKRSSLEGILARKPRMLVAIALAIKMARAAWAMLTKWQNYRVPEAAVARAIKPDNVVTDVEV